MKIGFLFSGQGAQYPGMIKDLYDSEEDVFNVFEQADNVLNRSISKICFEASQEELNLTHNTQPCMLAADIAAAMALKAHEIEADAVAGFSLGEYAALAYSGAISNEDAYKVIQIRADAMQAAVEPGKGAMAAFVGASVEQIEDIVKKVSSGYVAIANYNSNVQTVISGLNEGIDEACAIAAEQGVRAVKLAVSAPFHCELMKPAAERIGQELGTIAVSDPRIPVYMNVNGKPITHKEEIKELLVQQAMSPVQWVSTLRNMQEDGIDTFIECGAGKTLVGLVKKTLKDVRVFRVENKKTLDDTLAELTSENK